RRGQSDEGVLAFAVKPNRLNVRLPARPTQPPVRAVHTRNQRKKESAICTHAKKNKNHQQQQKRGNVIGGRKEGEEIGTRRAADVGENKNSGGCGVDRVS
ncbi:unnamed protein product, partial [Ectocarpus sp. 12 AP-2014]